MNRPRSEIRVESLLGFVGETETPLLVTAEATERGECRIQLLGSADYLSEKDRRPVTAYLTPTDAALIGHQLITASREATAPPKDA